VQEKIWNVIPRGDDWANQSEYQDSQWSNQSPGWNPIDQAQLRHMIYPEDHMLAGTLVPVVSPYTMWFGG
jgi:hypothetical protein